MLSCPRKKNWGQRSVLGFLWTLNLKHICSHQLLTIPGLLWDDSLYVVYFFLKVVLFLFFFSFWCFVLMLKTLWINCFVFKAVYTVRLSLCDTSAESADGFKKSALQRNDKKTSKNKIRHDAHWWMLCVSSTSIYWFFCIAIINEWKPMAGTGKEDILNHLIIA